MADNGEDDEVVTDLIADDVEVVNDHLVTNGDNADNGDENLPANDRQVDTDDVNVVEHNFMADTRDNGEEYGRGADNGDDEDEMEVVVLQPPDRESPAKAQQVASAQLLQIGDEASVAEDKAAANVLNDNNAVTTAPNAPGPFRPVRAVSSGTDDGGVFSLEKARRASVERQTTMQAPYARPPPRPAPSTSPFPCHMIVRYMMAGRGGAAEISRAWCARGRGGGRAAPLECARGGRGANSMLKVPSKKRNSSSPLPSEC